MKRGLREVLCEFIEQDEHNSIHYSIVPLERAHIKIVEFKCSKEKAGYLKDLFGAFLDANAPPVTVKGLKMIGDKVILASVESDYLVKLHHDVKTLLLDNNISVDTSLFTPGIPLFLSEQTLNVSQEFLGNNHGT